MLKHCSRAGPHRQRDYCPKKLSEETYLDANDEELKRK